MIIILQHLRGGITMRYQKIKPIIPFIFTFANAGFGFLSIIKTIEGDFIWAALCIVLAAIMDGIDGRLARYFGTAGGLGSELDSLCDAISFCLAPAVLLYSWYLHDFGHVGLFIPVLIIYVCAGILRLAKFNLTVAEQQLFFLGLPTTIAAFFFAQLVLYQELVAETALNKILNEKVIVGLVASIALLMISSIQFPSFKKPNLSIRTFATFLKLLAIIALTVWCLYTGYPFFLVLVTGYIVISLFRHGWFRVKKRFSVSKQKSAQ